MAFLVQPSLSTESAMTGTLGACTWDPALVPKVLGKAELSKTYDRSLG